MATSDTQTADTAERIFIGKGEQPAWLTLGLANRHGLVTGATGTGKTARRLATAMIFLQFSECDVC
jgi:DNA double-strand break repair helicase HerA and related ATPase